MKLTKFWRVISILSIILSGVCSIFAVIEGRTLYAIMWGVLMIAEILERIILTKEYIKK